MMKTQKLAIDGIPAIIWGEDVASVYIYVHGKMSHKEEAADFAVRAQQSGCQVLSFDLPEHGEREGDGTPCDVWHGIRDLEKIYANVQPRWDTVNLYGSSLGAYFGLMAYQNITIGRCLFVSPILDMQALIKNMMKWFKVTPETLEEKGVIPTPMGENLDWAYYSYVKAHPIATWRAPTFILWASEDNLTQRAVVEQFSERFHCDLTIMEGGEHWFHTQEQLAFLNAWLMKNV